MSAWYNITGLPDLLLHYMWCLVSLYYLELRRNPIIYLPHVYTSILCFANEELNWSFGRCGMLVTLRGEKISRTLH